ncbi:MAG: acyl-CoA dehydrogenase family protein [Minwuia sp.]|uniref:acyl-CoA dehydrogenase family protein n=1 Tax=Minwuia sp. TaxID=2493630 RepID=UPI003A8AE719
MGVYTHEHHEIIRSAKKLIEEEINPHVDDWEADGAFPAHEVFRKFGKLGFLGIHKPEAYGGLGLDYSYNLAFAEALGHIDCGGVPMAVGVQTDMATPALAKHGSDELRAEYLAPAIAGDMVACIGVSEPGAGSDVASLKSYAKKDGGDYVISGQKMWITNSWQADYMTMLVNTDPDGHIHRNKSLIVVPMDSPGIEKAKKLDKMGMRSSDTGLIFFDEVRVPQSNRIGDEGKGFTYQMEQFQEERMWAIASGLPGLEKAIQETIEYTSQRIAFGKPLINNQVIHFRLAEMQTEVEMLRSLMYRCIEEYVAGEDITKLASMGKLKVGRLKREVYDGCLQYFGGMGFMNETPISRRYRDGRLASIGGGADEVMLSIICKYMGTLPGKNQKTDDQDQR